MFNKDVLSFDIGTYNTKVIMGKGMGKKVKIKEAFTFRTPEGSVEDGQILNAEALKEKIQRSIREKDIRTKLVTFSIASTKAVMRELVLPCTNEKKIEAMIPFELSKHIPITVSDYVIDYVVLEVFNEGKVKKSRINVVALPKYIVKRYYDLCNELDMIPTSLVLHAIGSSWYFKDKPIVKSADENVVLIDLGHSCTNCSIIRDGKLLFNRIISVGLVDNMKGMTESEYIEKCMDELKLVFRFYLSIKNENKLDRIVLLGGGSKLDDIRRCIQEKLERPTEVFRDKGKFIINKKNKDILISQYFNAASALLLDKGR